MGRHQSSAKQPAVLGQPTAGTPALDCVIRKGLCAVLSSGAARGSVPLGFGLRNVESGSLEFPVYFQCLC